MRGNEIGRRGRNERKEDGGKGDKGGDFESKERRKIEGDGKERENDKEI